MYYPVVPTIESSLVFWSNSKQTSSYFRRETCSLHNITENMLTLALNSNKHSLVLIVPHDTCFVKKIVRAISLLILFDNSSHPMDCSINSEIAWLQNDDKSNNNCIVFGFIISGTCIHDLLYSRRAR